MYPYPIFLYPKNIFLLIIPFCENHIITIFTTDNTAIETFQKILMEYEVGTG